MRSAFLLLVSLFLACCSSADCDLLPLERYEWVLVNQDPESFFCWTQHHEIDMTTDESFGMAFAEGCHITLARGCGVTELDVLCDQGVNLTCSFQGNVGTCTNDLEAIVCRYDSWLDPLK